MPWWVWLAAGAALLALEMALIEADFYLVFLGLAAAAVGVLGLMGFGSTLWEQLLAFGVLSLIFMFGFRRRIYRLLRRNGRPPDLEGERLVLRDALDPGATGRAELRGSAWTVRNVGAETLPAGARARVLRVQGVTLEISAD